MQMTSLYTKANRKSLNTIKEILEIFSKYTELLEVNKEKSAAYYPKICSINPTSQGIHNIPIKAIPFQYLGIPIAGKKKTPCPMMEIGVINSKDAI